MPYLHDNFGNQLDRALEVTTIFNLIIEDDEGKTTVYPLTDGEISIGRREGNTIRLMERNVSRRHARLVRNQEAIFLEDLDSYNGVRINGERVGGRFEIKEGDLLEIGDYHLVLQRTDGAKKEADSAPISQRPERTDRKSDWDVGTRPNIVNPIAAQSELPKPGIIAEEPSQAVESTVPTTMLIRRPKSDMVEAPASSPAPAAPNASLPPFPASGVVEASQLPSLVEEQNKADGTPKPITRSLIATAPHARLVCVSTNYAGQDFSLERDELVIGRIDDNDIVIDHRSVSRNHARITLEGRTHRIIDLGSANGVLVNGEEYAMTNLRKGDLIELGHVCFRFVPAGETFVPTDEEAAEIRTAGVEPYPDGHQPSRAAAEAKVSSSAVPKVSAELKSPATFKPDSLAKTNSSRSAPAKPAGKQQTALLVLVGILTVVVVLLAVLLLQQNDATHDNVLQEFYNTENYTGVLEYYEKHREVFADPSRAATLRDQADAKLAEERSPPSIAPELETTSEDLDRVGTEPANAEPPKTDTMSVEIPGLDEASVNAPKPKQQRRVTATPEKRPRKPVKSEADNKREARRYAELGRNALMDGDLTKASKYLRTCIRLEPNEAECHRSLGIMYASRENTKAAIRHYQRYIQLQPDAPDAPQVKEIIQLAQESAESGQK